MAIVIAIPPVTIPSVIVPHGRLASAFPVAFKVLLALVTRAKPPAAFVRRTSPVAVMPRISRSVGIPVAFDKNVSGSRTSGLNPNYARGRRRSDSDAYVKIGSKGAASGEYRPDEQFVSHL